jgi:hypothetical protein
MVIILEIAGKRPSSEIVDPAIDYNLPRSGRTILSTMVNS